jgi:hypothetical protein
LLRAFRAVRQVHILSISGKSDQASQLVPVSTVNAWHTGTFIPTSNQWFDKITGFASIYGQGPSIPGSSLNKIHTSRYAV